jgi:hypothetical protein
MNKTDKSNVPERIELPNGYAFKRVGMTYVPTKDGREICWPWQLREAQAFAAAMAPQDGLRAALTQIAEYGESPLADKHMRAIAKAALAATPAAQQTNEKSDA